MKPILLAAFLALSGCAAAIQVGTAAPDNDPVVIGEGTRQPTAEILIYRANEAGLLTTVATSPALTLDGRAVGTCRFGAPLRLRVQAGVYEVGAFTQNGAVSQSVTVAEGETRHLRCGTAASSALAPRPSLEPVTPETASREARL